MKELQFVAARHADWAVWDEWLAGRSSKPRKSLPFTARELPHRYRELCHDLSLARDRDYSSPLIDRLHERVLRAQQWIYGATPRWRDTWLQFLVAGFPETVRREWRFVLPALLLFFVPLLLYIPAAHYWPESVYLVIPSSHAAQFEEMYSPDAPRLGRTRSDAGDDVAMLGAYIWNNLRLDFQCFAGGLLFGLGSLFYLVYNGLVIGATAGHLTRLGYIDTFWGFVAGHSGPELIGAVLAGAAGLRIGYALIAPGSATRLAALKRAAQVAIRILYGATAMTFAAAFIEAFWSPLPFVPPMLKYIVGGALWVLLIAYILLAGRRDPSPEMIDAA
jgi:uncharacterized membrane protein SpoIIM required for sporulation